MIKVIPVCTIHGDELRQEYLVDEENCGYRSGFCFKCAKHYRLCSETRYMGSCLHLRGHEGEHLDSNGHAWSGEWKY